MNDWGEPYQSALFTPHWSAWKGKDLFIPGRAAQLPNAGGERNGSTV
jgi:hypothetical protein